MDYDDVPSKARTSFRKFLEHLSGDGKAIGVLTSGGDAQGVRPSSWAGAEGDAGEKGWKKQGENVGTRDKRWGCGKKRSVGEQSGAREPQGSLPGAERAAQPPESLQGSGREKYGSRILHQEDQLIFHLHVYFYIETGEGVVWTALVGHSKSES